MELALRSHIGLEGGNGELDTVCSDGRKLTFARTQAYELPLGSRVRHENGRRHRWGTTYDVIDTDPECK